MEMGKEPTMMTTRLAIVVFVAIGLAGTPFAAQAKKYRHHKHHHVSAMQSVTYGASAVSTMPSGPHGASGLSIGTVTAPSIGSYYWPSVGVTNAVPTWNNTNPGVGR
jgi:hypothetical protein